jgi:hypothetical protein
MLVIITGTRSWGKSSIRHHKRATVSILQLMWFLAHVAAGCAGAGQSAGYI